MGGYLFRFKYNFAGESDYLIVGDGPHYIARLRLDAPEYWRSIFNGTKDRWQREIVAAIGLLRRYGGNDTPIRQEVVDAFNAWRLEEYLADWRQIDARPEKYGVIAPDDPLRAPPIVAKSGFWDRDAQTWVVTTPNVALAA